MKGNFSQCLELLLVHEGGFVDHPQDPGGMTNLGVTRKTLEDYLDRPVSEDEMRNLTPENVADLYKEKYWDKVKGDDLPSGLDWSVFDWAVNSGPIRAAKAVQRAAGAEDDGIIGPATLRAVNDMDVTYMIRSMHRQRQVFYESLKTFETFGRGWTRRNDETLDQSLEMV